MFNLKDQVRVKNGQHKGLLGTVVTFGINCVGVEFQSQIDKGHDCCGSGKPGYCYYFDDENLILC